MNRISREASLPTGGDQDFWGLIEWRALLTPHALCMVDEAGQTMTFEEYRSSCEDMAAGLHQADVGLGSVVAWQLPTRIRTLVFCGALARLGAVQVPIVPIYRRRELGFIFTATKPTKFFVSSDGSEETADERVSEAEAHGVECIAFDGALARETPKSLPPAPKVSDGDYPIRWIYFTSGTTGSPKGALHTDGSLIWGAHAEVDCLDLTPSDRTTLCFPVAHVGGSFFFMSGLISGHGQIVIENFSAASVEVLQRENVTYAGAGLAFQQVYLEAQRRQPGVALFPQIRGFPHGGDAKRAHMHETLIREMGGVGALSGYGMTEFAMISSGSVHDPQEKLLHRIGKPCEGITVRIVRSDEELCPAGVEGEIRAQGRSMCHGYLDPSQNEAGFDRDGFFRTGDVGFLDEDGYLEVTGRLKDIIIRKGENISAVEIEDLLYTHAAIKEVAVIGIPDPERGEMCCAVVVLNDPAASVALGDITEFLLSLGLMKQKCPERLEVRTSLPRDFSGKVKKSQLREECAP
jgi:acyl-CoA synthetase (AMP-forming)/AMP-acid ligase II